MNQLSSRTTPIDDSYPTCKYTEATLAIYYLDPDLVTRRLRLTPTSMQKRGVAKVMRNGRRVVGNIDNWLLSSKELVPSKDVRRHLDWLLDKVEPVGGELLQLQHLDVKMAVRCVWWSAHGQGGPTLWPEQMERMAKLNLECTFSFAWYGDYDLRITPDELFVHPDESRGSSKKRSMNAGQNKDRSQ